MNDQTPTPRPISIGLRLPKSLHEKVKEAAAERDVSANWLIVQAVREFLPRLLPVDEVRWTRSDHG